MSQYPPPEEYEAEVRRIARFRLGAVVVIWTAIGVLVVYLLATRL